MDELVLMVSEIGLPFAYDHFAEGESPEPPFLCYLLPGSRNFAADGRVYHKVNEVRLEFYTDRKEPEMELRIEDVLDGHGVFYNKSAVWIERERLYKVLYVFEWEAG